MRNRVHVPDVLNMCPDIPRPRAATRSALPCPRASAYPTYQPPWLVIRLLWSLGQVPAPVLQRSWSIGTNPHGIHLSPSTTIPMLHTCISQADRHGCTYIISRPRSVHNSTRGATH
jgi:hypothetical protein